MKYQQEYTVAKPLDDLIDDYINEDLIPKWQEGLVKRNRIRGTYPKTGCKTELVFDLNGKEMRMVEEIKSNNLPYQLVTQYDAKNVKNIITVAFRPVDEHSTRMIVSNEFIFSGIMKIVGFFLSSMFKAQTRTYMEAFKQLAEQS